MMKLTLLATGAALLGTLGVVIDAQSRKPPRRPAAETGRGEVFASGRVEGATPEIELRPQLAGRIEEILAEEGQWVEKSQVLFRLDDAQYRQQVALAAAELELAEAQLQRRIDGAHEKDRAQAAAKYRAKLAELQQAQLRWQRVKSLRRTNAVSQEDADDQRTLVEALTAEAAAAKAYLDRLEAPARTDEVAIDQAKVEAAKATLELAKVQLDRTAVRAPSRGRILQINVETGELAGPDSPEPAIIMADTSRFQVRAFVEEMDAPRVKAGMTATITADGLPGKSLTGRLTRISPRMSRKQIWSDRPAERYDTKVREVWLTLPTDLPLVVGLPVDVMINPESGMKRE